MRKVIKVTRWFLGVLLCIISLIYLFTGDIIFSVILLSIGLILLPPISQRLFDKKKENERTLFGKIVKYLFIGFNICFLIYIISMIIKLLVRIQSPISQGTLESASMGIPVLIISLLLIWLSGNFILGLLTFFTRPKKTKIL